MIQKIPEILKVIENGDCVLILGPDLQETDGRSFFKAMCEDFKEANDYSTSFDEVVV